MLHKGNPAAEANARNVLPLAGLSFGAAAVAAASLTVAACKIDDGVGILPDALHEKAQKVARNWLVDDTPTVLLVPGAAAVALGAGALSYVFGHLSLHCWRISRIR